MGKRAPSGPATQPRPCTLTHSPTASCGHHHNLPCTGHAPGYSGTSPKRKASTRQVTHLTPCRITASPGPTRWPRTCTAARHPGSLETPMHTNHITEAGFRYIVKVGDVVVWRVMVVNTDQPLQGVVQQAGPSVCRQVGELSSIGPGRSMCAVPRSMVMSMSSLSGRKPSCARTAEPDSTCQHTVDHRRQARA